MPGFAGVDAYDYPGPEPFAWLKANTNLVWCGYYLAPSPSHVGTSWVGHRAALAGAGWGIAPTYLGQELKGRGSHKVTRPQGTLDGQDAVRLMGAEGFVGGSFVYLDLEDGAPFLTPRTDYVAAWIAAVAANGYQPGVYCSHTIAPDVHFAHPEARLWVFNVPSTTPHPFPGANFPDPAPAGSGYVGTYMWQLGQACQISLQVAPNSLNADLSSAVAPDPGAP